MTPVCHQRALSMGHSSRRRSGTRRQIDVAAAQEIVQSADPIPAIAVGLDHQPMLTALNRMAVVLRQKIDQELAVLGMLLVEADRERDFSRLRIEIMHN